MIDEQQPMQIGMFPMDVKCQTPQQLQLHHQQHQQHLQYQHPHQHQHQQHHPNHHSQQQPNQHLHHNGNERMLTTPSSSLVGAAGGGGGGGVTPPASSAATTTTASATSPPPLPPPPAPPAAAPSSSASGGKGSCNNHSGGMNNKTTLLHGGSGPSEAGRPLLSHQQQHQLHPHHQHQHQQQQHQRPSSTDNQQSNVCGPGPPGPQQPPPPPPPATVASNSGNNTKGNGNGNNELTNGSGCLVVSPTSGNSGAGGGAATLPHALLPPNAGHTLTSVSGRIALGECTLNAGGSIDWPNNGGGGGGGIDDEDDDDCGNNNGAVLPISMTSLSGGVRVGVIGLTSGMPIATAPHHQVQHHPHHLHHHNNNNHQAVTTMAIPNASSSASASMTRKLPLSSANCALCCQPICDRYIMRVVDTSFHEGCLKCATCSLHLVQSCFTRDGKLYCRIDYERLFMRNRCLGCGHKINSEELVMRTLENVFHLKCFACVVCGCMLKKGEQYVVKQGQLFCRFDYEKEVEMLQGYDFYGDDLFPPKLDGRRGPKRPRTILNTQQRRAFKASFEVSPKPCRKVRENLAKETGLSLRIVQVWFQNQRAKVKKIQKKAKQEHPKGHSDSQDSQESDSSCLAKIKDEAHSDTESLLESPFVLGGGGVGGGGGGGLTMGGGAVSGQAELMGGCGGVVGVGGKLSRCIIKDEHENTSFNCMETNKENCNKTNEPILNTILGLSYATFQQLMGPFSQSPMINPIDRLYSMQHSYFRPDDSMGGYSECGKDVGEL